MSTASEAATRLELRRTFAVPVATVYAAFTDPAQMKHWMAPDDAYRAAEVTVDLRVGGRFRIVMHAPDGEVHRVGGTYREIEPGRKLVYTWAWESTPERESLVTVRFRPDGHGTELLLTHERFADTAARDRHREGWNGCLGRLDRRLAR